MNIIPALDLRDGQVVRLRRGQFGSEQVYSREPLVLARQWRRAGAEYLHIVDLDRAAGFGENLAVIKEISSSSGLQVQCGGGIRCREDVDWLLDAGVQSVVLGSVACRDVSLTTDLLRGYGGDRIILAMDLQSTTAARGYEVRIDAWRASAGIQPDEFLQKYVSVGLQRVLCTDVDRDGGLCGPNIELYRWLTEKWPGLRFVASGGVSGEEDLRKLESVGVDGVVVGRALLDGRLQTDGLWMVKS